MRGKTNEQEYLKRVEEKLGEIQDATLDRSLFPMLAVTAPATLILLLPPQNDAHNVSIHLYSYFPTV